jgi:hypothetical protein
VWTGLLATTVLTIGLGILYSPVLQIVTDAAKALS